MYAKKENVSNEKAENGKKQMHKVRKSMGMVWLSENDWKDKNQKRGERVRIPPPLRIINQIKLKLMEATDKLNWNSEFGIALKRTATYKSTAELQAHYDRIRKKSNKNK